MQSDVDDLPFNLSPSDRVAMPTQEQKASCSLAAGLSDEALAASHRGGETRTWQVLYGLLRHLCYHTSEVIGSRHLQGLWVEGV